MYIGELLAFLTNSIISNIIRTVYSKSKTMTKPILLRPEFVRNLKKDSWTFEMIYKGFTEHINEFQTLDDWNQLVLANPIDSTSWQHIYAMAQGYNDFGEDIIVYFKEPIVNNADQSLNTIKEFIDLNCMEFFYQDYGLYAHNLLLEFVIYLGTRLSTTFDSFLPDVHKYIKQCKMDPKKTSYPVAFEKYFEACEKQDLGNKRQRELQKFCYYCIKPLLFEKDFSFFCKLIYSANLVRSMNRFTLGHLDTTDEPHIANPFGFSPYPNESYNSVIAYPNNPIGVSDFLAVHYLSEVFDFQEGLLIETKLEKFIKRSDITAILSNPLDSYFGYVKIFLDDYVPKLATKFNKFVKAQKKTQLKIDAAFYKWALIEDNQAFILDLFGHNLNNIEEGYLWHKKLNQILQQDHVSTRLAAAKMVDIEPNTMKSLSPENWRLFSSEYSKFFENVFDEDIKLEAQAKIELTKSNSKVLNIVETKANIRLEKPNTEPKKQKFVYVRQAPQVLSAINDDVEFSFERLFDNSLFIYDESKIEREFFDQTNVKSTLELVSNAIKIAHQTAKPNSNTLQRFIAITLFPDKFLLEGAIIPNGKVKVFQANQYPYLEGDCEIILSPKARMFLRSEGKLIRIVSLGNPNYH